MYTTVTPRTRYLIRNGMCHGTDCSAIAVLILLYLCGRTLHLWLLLSFLPHDAMLAQAGIVSKRLSTGLRKQKRMIALTLVFWCQRSLEN